MTIKVLTMNIHHGRGTDRQVDLARIAKVLKSSRADIIGLNEVDRCYSQRSHFADQAAWLAENLGMNLAFGPSLQKRVKAKEDSCRQFGNALLSRFPILKFRNDAYDRVHSMESRSLLDTTLRWEQAAIRVMVTHLSLYPIWRQQQVHMIIQRLQESTVPFIVMGDFNMRPGTGSWKKLTLLLQDVSESKGVVTLTFPAARPRKQLDYIFASREWTVDEVSVPLVEPDASDHLPLAAALRL